jgi:hypothetical protein
MNRLFLLGVIFISACTVSEKVSSGVASDVTEELTYFKDKHGLCYATISSQTHIVYQVISIANVPCNSVGL